MIKMSHKALTETLLNYYCEHDDDFIHDIEELDGWSGCLGYERIEPMEVLDEIYQSKEVTEILERAYFGYDADDWYEENGKRVHSKFNPNRVYFYFNGYGNLVSTNYCDYSDYLDVDYVQDIIDNERHLCLSDGAQEIIDSYDQVN